jgi:hypothetical protein
LRGFRTDGERFQETGVAFVFAGEDGCCWGRRFGGEDGEGGLDYGVAEGEYGEGVGGVDGVGLSYLEGGD